MSLATIRTKLQQRIAAITDIGVVTDFEPYADRRETLETYFKADSLDYLQGWTITRERSDERDFELDNNAVEHAFVIRGYRVLADDAASEKAFQDKIEEIRAVLRAEESGRFDGEAQIAVSPPSVRLVEVRKFSDYLVHYCEITQRITELVA